MIEIKYYRKYNRVTITGHAESGEHGKDLVCAACSALAYTLAANVSNLSDNGLVRVESIKLEPGNAEIWAKANSSKALVSRIIEAICVGFEIIATEYPQYVSYEIR